jgi:hypothetical protein
LSFRSTIAEGESLVVGREVVAGEEIIPSCVAAGFVVPASAGVVALGPVAGEDVAGRDEVAGKLCALAPPANAITTAAIIRQFRIGTSYPRATLRK